MFRLRIYGEKSFPEIAAALGEPEAAVKSRYYRLVKRLRKEFQSMNDMEIPMPTPEEKERAVAEILAACPRRPWLWRELEETFRAVGLKNLFFGTGDCLFLGAAGAAPLPVSCGPSDSGAWCSRSSPLFLSPALYAALVLLTAWKEQQSGTLELLGVARISLRMLAALRMLCFGGASVAVCVPISLTVWQAVKWGAVPGMGAVPVPVQLVSLWSAVPVLSADEGLAGPSGGALRLGRCRGGTDALGKDGRLAGGRAGGGLLSGGRRGHRSLSDGVAPLLPTGRWKEVYPMLTVEHVTKAYGKFTALEDISLTFTPRRLWSAGPQWGGEDHLDEAARHPAVPHQGADLVGGGGHRPPWGAEYRGLLGYLPQRFGLLPQ